MNLYLISQDENNGYDTYSEAIVCAPSEEVAKNISPSDGTIFTQTDWDHYKSRYSNDWATTPDNVECKLISNGSIYTVPGLVLASFHAG